MACRSRALVGVVVLFTTFLILPSAAHAQTERHGGSLLYGLSGGVGHRSTSGLFVPADPAIPTGAGQPPSSFTIGTLDLEGGVTITGRLAVLGQFNRGSAIGGDGHGWGALSFHGTVRVWPIERVWLEAGPGAGEIAFRTPNQPQTTTTRWWAPGVVIAAGYEIFQGPTITLDVLGRYTTVKIDGLRVNEFSVQVGLLGRVK